MKINSYMRYIFCLGLLGSLAFTSLPAQEKEKSEPSNTEKSSKDDSVMIEFRSLEEQIRLKKRSSKVRKITLETNLLRAMRSAIFRRFYLERKDLSKNLNAQNIIYDNPTSPLVYYVKYVTTTDNGQTRTIIGRFDFSRSPEFYIQIPAYEKVLIRTSGEVHEESKSKK